MSLTALGNQQIAQRLYRFDRIHPPLPSPEAVNEQSVRAYHEQGFLAVENVFSAQDVELAKQSLRRLVDVADPEVINFEDSVKPEELATMSADERERYVRKFMHFVKHDAYLMAMSRHPALLNLVRRLVGTEVNLLQDMAMLKPPHIGREKPWHQDMAYFPLEPRDLVIGTWTALDPATTENGCMHVIPASHLAGPRPHYHDRDCQLPDEDVDVARDVAVPLSPGGVLFFNGLTHHGTPPNQSAQRRRALQFHYASADCRAIDGTSHQALFHDGGGYAGCAGAIGLKTRRVEDRQTSNS